MKRINNKYIFTALIIVILIIYIAVLTKGNDVYKCNILSEDDYITLDTWTFENDNSQVTLPVSVEYTGEPAVFSKKLDYEEEFQDIPYMLLKSKYYDYKIYLDDEQIYAHENPKKGFTTTNGAQIRIIRLGEDIKGKTLKMEITPLLGDSIKYPIIAPIVGSKTDIVWHSIKMEQPEVIMDIIIMLFGVVLIILYFLMRGIGMGDKMFYLGMMSIAGGIYMACQYRVTHIIAPNSYMLYFVEYTALNILPFLVAIFMYTNVYGKAKKMCGAMSIILLVNVVFQNVMNFIFNIEFRLLLPFTHMLIVLLAVVIVTVMFMLRKEKSIRHMLLSFIPPVIGGIVDLIIIYTSINEKSIHFFPIGLYIFVIMQAVDTCKKYIEMSRKRMSSEIYERLAFTDGLTGLYNRLAFENDINKKIQGNKAACISIDLNNLKIANDTMGHSAGDILIRGISGILKEAVRNLGKIYRIGGDEFVVLLDNIEHIQMNELLDRIMDCKERYNAENDVPIDFAIGTSYYDENDISFEKLVLRADQKMYKNKRETKRIQRYENDE